MSVTKYKDEEFQEKYFFAHMGVSKNAFKEPKIALKYMLILSNW
jgi:hypothetical protein